MATKFKVVITKTETDVPAKDKSYEVVGKDEDGENRYEYVYFDTTETVTEDIFEQTIPELDVEAVIKAVNGL